jgi:hypothetical protein
MTTNWTLPSAVTQYAEPGGELAHVSWNNDTNFSGLTNISGRSVKTSRDLVHIARDPKHDIIEKTYYLKVSSFNFISLPGVLSGIEVRLTMNRSGRITDETVQLCLGSDLRGDNQASLNLDPIKVYGGENTLWNSNLTLSNIQNPVFGVVLRFQSHPNWPHKSSPLINSVELRIH